MSEQLNIHPNKHVSHSETGKEHIPVHEGKVETKAEQREHDKPRVDHVEKSERQRRNIEHLSSLAESEAKSHKETRLSEEKEAEHRQPALGMQRELKTNAYQATIQKVRSRLSPSNRTFSKVVHQPTVDAISEFSAKTIARPSAVLGAGIVSTAGSGFVLFMAKYYGFRYNFFIFLGLLAAGFIAGIIVELLLRGVRLKAKS